LKHTSSSTLPGISVALLILATGCGAGDGGALGDGDGEIVAESTEALYTVNATPVSLTYKGSPAFGGSSCNTVRNMKVYEPTNGAPGQKFPVLIYTVGYIGNYNSTDANEAAKQAAQQGFVAATMEYAYGFFDGLDCPTTKNKANCSYNPNLTNSAVKVLCSRSLADCSKGVATAGHSLGGAMAVLAKNYDSRVRAVWTMGTANGNNTTTCMNPGTLDGGSTDRKLRNNEWRAYGGQADTGNPISGMNTVTGQSCAAGTQSCLRTDGSGWYQVQNSQVVDSSADHCFQEQNGCGSGGTDANWRTGTSPWTLGTSMAWLKGRTSP
jgi:hypothetical protein